MFLQTLIFATLATVALSVNLPDYTTFKGLGAYKLHSTFKTWSDAWKTCKDEGSNLLVINSQREANAIEIMYKYGHYDVADGAWIGVHDMFVENEFVTTLGYPLSMAGYTHWNTGEPNNANGNENCVMLFRDKNFNDDKCDKVHPFFCEA